MTFHISGCKHDTKLILVLVLTFSRSRISKMLKKLRYFDRWPWNSRSHTFILWPSLTPAVYMMQTWPWCRLQHFQCQRSQKTQNQSPDLDVWPWKSRSEIFLHDLSYLRLQTWYEVDLSVDFNIFKIEDIENIKNKHVTVSVDLETQGHELFSYDLAYFRLYACYLLDLGVESNILKVEDLRKSIFGYLTLMFDFDFQGQATSLQIYIIFKISRYRYINYFWFLEFFDLDYVKINTEIKSAACIQPEIMKVIRKNVWFSRSTLEVRRHTIVILRFQTSNIFKSTPTLCLYYVYNPW